MKTSLFSIVLIALLAISCSNEKNAPPAFPDFPKLELPYEMVGDDIPQGTPLKSGEAKQVFGVDSKAIGAFSNQGVDFYVYLRSDTIGWAGENGEISLTDRMPFLAAVEDGNIVNELRLAFESDMDGYGVDAIIREESVELIEYTLDEESGDKVPGESKFLEYRGMFIDTESE